MECAEWQHLQGPWQPYAEVFHARPELRNGAGRRGPRRCDMCTTIYKGKGECEGGRGCPGNWGYRRRELLWLGGFWVPATSYERLRELQLGTPDRRERHKPPATPQGPYYHNRDEWWDPELASMETETATSYYPSSSHKETRPAASSGTMFAPTKRKCQQHKQKPAGMKDVSVQEVRGVSGSQSTARQKMQTRKWWTLLLAHLLIMSHHPQPNGSSPQYLRTTLGQALTAGMNQQEILAAAATASSQAKGGGKGGGKPGVKRRATDGGHKDDQHEMLRSLTRSYLYFKADAMPILDSSVVVVLFRKATLAKKFTENAAKWHSHEPAAVERGQKRQPHPWGPKKVVMLTQLWKEISDKTAQMPEDNDGSNAKSQCLEATKRLSGLTPCRIGWELRQLSLHIQNTYGRSHMEMEFDTGISSRYGMQNSPRCSSWALQRQRRGAHRCTKAISTTRRRESPVVLCEQEGLGARCLPMVIACRRKPWGNMRLAQPTAASRCNINACQV